MQPDLTHLSGEEPAYTYGAREISFATTGDPLMDKRIFEFISYAKKTGYRYVYISTNGALLNERKINKLINSGIDSIKFSVNAGSRKSYEAIHGSDDFDHVISSINKINKLRVSNNIKVLLLVTSVIDNKIEEQELANLLDGVVDDIEYAHPIENVGPTNGCLDESQICSIIFNRLHVTVEGYLTACCVDYENQLVVADLNKIDIKEAWFNMVFQELRRKHINGDLEGLLCDTCKSRKLKDFSPILPVIR